MRIHALLGATLLVAVSAADASYDEDRVNDTYVAASASASEIQELSPSIATLAPSPVVITLTYSEDETSSTDSPDSDHLSDSQPNISPPSSSPGISRSPGFTHVPWDNSTSSPNATSVVTRTLRPTNSLTLQTGLCTGCVIQAYNPMTTFFDEADIANPWTSVVVTETILIQYVTYVQNGTIDGVATEEKTMNQTKTVLGTMNQTITHSTPTFILEPTPGVYLTVDAGPTYVVYNDIDGGLDEYVDRTQSALNQTLKTCAPHPTTLENWEPTKTEHWSYFIETYTGEPPNPVTDFPVTLPAKLINFLKQDPDVEQQFSGSDIATCTLYTTPGADGTPGSPNRESAPPHFPPPEFTRTKPYPRPSPVVPEIPEAPSTSAVHATSAQATAPASLTTGSATTGTFLSTTFASTSTHVTRQGCLRCLTTHSSDEPQPMPDGRITNNINTPITNPTYKPDDGPNNQPNANGQDKPSIWPHTPAGQSITISGSVFPVNTARPTQNSPDRPSEQNQVPPFIVIGSETLTPGQTKTINGVAVVAPTDGGGTRIIVGGSTVIYNPVPTGPPILTVGSNTITANSQGQFVVGSQTLQPGGSQIVVDGSTLSLGPSGGVVVVNGVTQTLAKAPAPTRGPALTVGGQVIAANVISGTTAYVFGPGQTLAPGGVLTFSGNTYSMPASEFGTIVVINGVTSTLATRPSVITAAPVLTINSQTYSASIRDGTTEYVLGAGTTLKPGDAVTVSGTTYSLDSAGTALIINGKTSSIPKVPASNSASTTRSASTSRSALSSSTTVGRGAGDLIASGIGESSRAGGTSMNTGGIDKWIERLVVGVAGWLLLLL